jgi:hypothetical protein
MGLDEECLTIMMFQHLSFMPLPFTNFQKPFLRRDMQRKYSSDVRVQHSSDVRVQHSSDVRVLLFTYLRIRVWYCCRVVQGLAQGLPFEEEFNSPIAFWWFHVERQPIIWKQESYFLAYFKFTYEDWQKDFRSYTVPSLSISRQRLASASRCYYQSWSLSLL